MINEPLVGYGGLTPEAMHEIINRAHRARKEALGQVFAWLFRRRETGVGLPITATRASAVACGTTR